MLVSETGIKGPSENIPKYWFNIHGKKSTITVTAEIISVLTGTFICIKIK